MGSQRTARPPLGSDDRRAIPSSVALRSALASFLVVTLATAPLDATTEFVRGDVNEDGVVSIADLTRLIGFVILDGADPLCHDSADVDDDGQIALTDAIWMISFLFGPDGSDALPAPYPDPGVDPTADDLSPCNAPQGEPTGSELPHIFFFGAGAAGAAGFAIAPGQGPVYVPLRVTTPQPVEGMTISLSYETTQLDSLLLDFEGGVPSDHDADLRIGHVSATFPGRVYGYILMEILPPFDTASFPAGDGLLVGHAVIEPSATLPIGSVVEIRFETLPPTGQEPPIRNELAYEGAVGSTYPITQTLLAPVAPLESIFVRGDANRDGRVDITDGVALLQYLFLGIPDGIQCLDASDADDSGAIDLADPLHVLFALFMAESTLRPAAPFPYQGTDTTPLDPFGCVPASN